jgi:hypothetical protein
MSDRYTLQPGGAHTFLTRPVGLSTNLFLRGGAGDSVAIWHIELCCKPDNHVALEGEEPRAVNISEAAGALVSVRNGGFNSIEVWTDY